MIKFLFSSFIFFAGSARAAEGISSNIPDSCTARLSNVAIKNAAPDVTKGAMFCSGTLIDSTTLVTAAHCMNEVVSKTLGNLDNIKDERSIEIAFGDSKTSQSHQIQTGLSAALTTSAMKDHQARQKFIQAGTLKQVGQDIVIVKLANPVSNFSQEKCPRLPTIEDCQKFSQYLNTTARDHTQGSVYFYQSSFSKSGTGAATVESPYPNTRQILANLKKLFVNAEFGYFQASFQSGGGTESKPVALKKGDSGAGFIWNVLGEKILMGVQSAASQGDASKGFFAQSCTLIQDPRWKEILNPAASKATKAFKKAGVSQ